MAKLSAGGRDGQGKPRQEEMARYSRETVPEYDPILRITWKRTTYAFMSSGKVLRKQDFKYRDPNRGELREGSGWKLAGKMANVEEFRRKMEGAGFTKEG